MSVWDFRMQGDREAEVYLYEEIGEYWGRSAKDFVAELDALGEIDQLTVRINSMGGSVFDGFTIHSRLSTHPANVTIKIDGIAASIASVIAMAGDDIQIAENGFFMIHQPWTFAMGTAKDLRDEADVLDKLQAQGIKAYSKRSGQSEDDVLAMMNDGLETWLNAEESVEKGFADSIMEGSNATQLCIDRNLYPNAPAALKHRPTKAQAARKIEQAKAEREAEAIAIRLRVLELDCAT